MHAVLYSHILQVSATMLRGICTVYINYSEYSFVHMRINTAKRKRIQQERFVLEWHKKCQYRSLYNQD